MSDYGSTPSVQALWDIEQIKQLKARYFRFIDLKQFDAFTELFTEDCQHHLPSEAGKDVAIDNATYFPNMKGLLASSVTTHHGHMPEITLLSETEAEGVWSMFDYVQTDSPQGNPGGKPVSMQGFGHYYETYRKGADGQWRISSKRNTRQRIDDVPNTAFPNAS